MKPYILAVAAVVALAGCSPSADVMLVRRDSSESGSGTVQAAGQRLTAVIGSKKCSGNFATVPDFASSGLLNTYGQKNNATATVSISSATGNAAGLLTCDDGDVWRCEIRHSGPSGYGICVGKDGAVYDVVTGRFK